jgi:hypothetical protein
MKILIILSITLLFGCCKDEGQKSILIVNNSNKKVSVDFDTREVFLCDSKRFFEYIEPKDSFRTPNLRECDNWETRLTNSSYSWYVVLVDFDTANSISCDTIFKYNLYKKKVKLNIDSMIKNNWTITYP